MGEGTEGKKDRNQHAQVEQDQPRDDKSQEPFNVAPGGPTDSFASSTSPATELVSLHPAIRESDPLHERCVIRDRRE
jgi:hypothetical protein